MRTENIGVDSVECATFIETRSVDHELLLKLLTRTQVFVALRVHLSLCK